MPRDYKTDPHGKKYSPVSQNIIDEAKKAVHKGLSIRSASKQFGIPYTVLHRHVKNNNVKKIGGQTALSEDEEALLVDRLAMCAEWGYPIDRFDLQCIVKGYLDRRGRVVRKFTNNMPGKDFAELFIKRHKDRLSIRMCQNIKRARAGVTPAIINEYFDHLEKTLAEVPPQNIINFDETNLQDDPGRKKVISKRGTKYPERVMKHSNSSTSVMFAASGSGVLLPCYVVYKSNHLYSSWTEGGPRGTRFNRTKSGWFDSLCFDDWIRTIVIPYLKQLEGKKYIIGDNLSSHLSVESIKACQDHQISCVFLPSNSTHLTQPLDVAFFRPVKVAWRNILLEWKNGPGRKESCVPKDVFPRLLKKLLNKIELNHVANIKAGFSKAGIIPLNRQQVLKMLPQEIGSQHDNERAETELNGSFRAFLQEMRYEGPAMPRKRRKKIDVVPGMSVEVQGGGDDDNNDVPPVLSSESEMDVDTPDSGEEETALDSNADCAGRNTTTIDKCGFNTFPVRPQVEEITEGDWLVVGFSTTAANSTTAGSSKLRHFIGKVLNITVISGGKVFEGTFVRSKVTRDHNGFIYVFPNVPDVSSFSYEQVVQKLTPPETFRRGQLKFGIKHSYLQ